MAVLCEAISVVIRRDSIDAFYKGGWAAFQNDVPNKAMCTDEELVRVGFMSPDAVGAYIEKLEANGQPSKTRNCTRMSFMSGYQLIV